MDAPPASTAGAPALHPSLSLLEPLVGEWSGSGSGSYPTIEPFAFRETVRFAPAPGRPFIAYSQQTWSDPDGRPLHAETGYLRPAALAGAELLIVQPTGVAEVLEGSVRKEGRAVELALRSRAVATSSTAKDVTAVARSYRLEGGVLTIRVAIAAVGHPLTHHLASELRASPPAPR